MNRLFRITSPSLPAVIASMGMALGAVSLANAGEKAPKARSGNHTTTIDNTDQAQKASWSDGKLKVTLAQDGDEFTASVNGKEVLSFSKDDAQKKDSDIGAEWTEGGREVKFAVEDGALKATVDGEDAVAIGLDGNAIMHNGWAGGGEFQQRLAEQLAREGMRMDELREKLRGARGMAFLADSPKVMIGVTMESGDEVEGVDLPEGVKAEDVTIITRVIKGLPADKAGLHENDVITRVDGKAPANPPAIREALKEKKAGDGLAFTYLRDGSERTAELQLAAYDAHALGGSFSPGATWSQGGTPQAWSFNLGADDENRRELAELQEKINKLSAEMEALGEKMADTSGKEARDLAKQMAELGSQMGELGGEMARLSARSMVLTPMPAMPPLPPTAAAPSPAPPPARVILPRSGGPRGALVVPQGHAAESDERVQALEDRLDRIEKMLEKIADEKSSGGEKRRDN